jgi:hypothetical protein
MIQVIAIVLVIGFLTLFQVSILSLQTVVSSRESSTSNSIVDESESEQLVGNAHFSNQNNAVGTSKKSLDQKKDNSHITLDFALPAPETSASNYNYLYNDGDSYNDNPDENETETTRSNGVAISSSNVNPDETGGGLAKSSSSLTDAANPPPNGLGKSGGDKTKKSALKSPSTSGQIKNGRRNKLRENSHYQQRKKLLESVFLSVKTTKRFHTTRLEPILKTWFNLAREQVIIVIIG